MSQTTQQSTRQSGLARTQVAGKVNELAGRKVLRQPRANVVGRAFVGEQPSRGS